MSGWWSLRANALISFFLHTDRGRFLIAGSVNTAFSYLSFAALYYILSHFIRDTPIWIASAVINITFSFVTHKVYVFRTRGNWVRAYMRYYAVYAIPFFLGLTAFTLFVDVVHVNAYVAQALIIFVNTVISYVGHKYFSFRKPREKSASY
jgi:putative flippase GtrA